jgi:hypothetical protein
MRRFLICLATMFALSAAIVVLAFLWRFEFDDAPRRRSAEAPAHRPTQTAAVQVLSKLQLIG